MDRQAEKAVPDQQRRSCCKRESMRQFEVRVEEIVRRKTRQIGDFRPQPGRAHR
jgi:hypothetical protein